MALTWPGWIRWSVVMMMLVRIALAFLPGLFVAGTTFVLVADLVRLPWRGAARSRSHVSELS